MVKQAEALISETQDVPKNRLVPATGSFRWEGVAVKEYKPTDSQAAGFHGITRQTLFGGSSDAVGFEVRYFEIAPGGWSSLECHEHAHAVIGLRGRGKILLGEEVRPLGFLDLAYVGPHQVHRLANDSDEPFGFLCVVDAERDRPRLLASEDVPHLLGRRDTAELVLKTVSSEEG